jgi:O-methyltransferase
MGDYDFYHEHTTDHGNPRNWFMGQPIITDQVGRNELGVICGELERVLERRIPGAIAEFGCYAGTSSLFIRRVLDAHQQSAARPFHVYDSFRGLPEKGPQDQNAATVDFTAGKLFVSKAQFVKNFKGAGLALPVIHKGWFSELTEADVPGKIAFAFLDGDFYDSILVPLKLVWPRLQPGGALLIDDYGREALPGPQRAVRDFFRDKVMPTVRTEQGIGIIIKSAP